MNALFQSFIDKLIGRHQELKIALLRKHLTPPGYTIQGDLLSQVEERQNKRYASNRSKDSSVGTGSHPGADAQPEALGSDIT